MRAIRDLRVAAPLKRRRHRLEQERRLSIRDLRVAAPLKRTGSCGLPAGPLGPIRDLRVAAPLKL